jgi:folylpolyglutamate synthase/dihydropteroate synthase
MKRTYERSPGLTSHSPPFPPSRPSSSSKVNYDTEAINQDIARYALNLLRDSKKDQLPLLGKLQPQHILQGLKANLPCRFEHFLCHLSHSSSMTPLSSKILVILDMAHNEGGIQALVWRLQHFYPKRRYR